jgi:hypothetical protein
MLGEGPTLSNNTLLDNRELRALSAIEYGGKAPSSLPVFSGEVCIKLKEVIFAAIRQRVPSIRESIKN